MWVRIMATVLQSLAPPPAPLSLFLPPCQPRDTLPLPPPFSAGFITMTPWKSGRPPVSDQQQHSCGSFALGAREDALRDAGVRGRGCPTSRNCQGSSFFVPFTPAHGTTSPARVPCSRASPSLPLRLSARQPANVFKLGRILSMKQGPARPI